MLWERARDLITRYEPQRWIYLRGQSTEFASALQYGSECQTIYTKSF